MKKKWIQKLKKIAIIANKYRVKLKINQGNIEESMTIIENKNTKSLENDKEFF